MHYRRSVLPLDELIIAEVRSFLRGRPHRGQPYLSIFSLGYGEGLTAQEIAGMRIKCLVGDDLLPGPKVRVAPETTLQRAGRNVRMHPDVRADIRALLEVFRDVDYVAFDPQTRSRLSATKVTFWYRRLFRELGLQGYSLNSARRYFRESVQERAR